jgi:hypothetical protein
MAATVPNIEPPAGDERLQARLLRIVFALLDGWEDANSVYGSTSLHPFGASIRTLPAVPGHSSACQQIGRPRLPAFTAFKLHKKLLNYCRFDFFHPTLAKSLRLHETLR